MKYSAFVLKHQNYHDLNLSGNSIQIANADEKMINLHKLVRLFSMKIFSSLTVL